MSKVKRVVGCKGFSNDEFIAIAESRNTSCQQLLKQTLM